MVAVLGLEDEKVETICASIDAFVVPANYNCPGQLVISGTKQGIAQACVAMESAGSKGVVALPVNGAFHSTHMASAQESLVRTIRQTNFQRGTCPIYQNVAATPTTDPMIIQERLLRQLTEPVQWAQTIQRMIKDGAKRFVVCGPGKVLQGLMKRINPDAQVLTL
eukprot:CAMPEP_0116836638 /NCGR_PEP_ID=MMETSP0418-20121206/8211_1 /TAXON_ID=1158023 /ORGANISM="Astrosyne radiata, Strain 13vi08-1A" /LENGTH=164 /DNA_ID=CAMNT_0004466437 /DNA_START=889 /DNA_END=1383 /DNA_ORIENTATION=-